MLGGRKRSYVLSFLGMCKILLLKIKKLILFNVLTECTSMQTQKS